MTEDFFWVHFPTRSTLGMTTVAAAAAAEEGRVSAQTGTVRVRQVQIFHLARQTSFVAVQVICCLRGHVADLRRSLRSGIPLYP
jgi:hypothetical protein